MQPSVLEPAWYQRAFERIYLRLYPHRSDEEAERNAPTVCRLLGVRPGQRVLDAACGAGRYTRALARRGMRMTGVDLSGALLEEARERSPGLPGSPTYIQWDIRELPFRGQFDGAISMFTSFGYFGDRSDDLQIMKGVHRALVPGGTFLVDYLNEAAVRTGLEPVTETMIGGLVVRMERRIREDAAGGPRVEKRVHATHAHTGLEAADFEESVRLYTLAEIDALLADAGFAIEGEPLGDLEASGFGPDAARLVRVARRPTRNR